MLTFDGELRESLQLGQLVGLEVTYQRTVDVQVTQELVVLQLPQLQKALPEVPQRKMLQKLHVLEVLEDVLIQPPQFLKEDVLDILAPLADHPKVLVLEVAK